jgi:rhodanese-related sulfurtransferase
MGALVPRQSVPIVLVSGASRDGLTERAARRLAEFGYTDVCILAQGCEGWEAAGFELFSGINVPSKAFGEFIEHRYDTPRLTADELKTLMDEGRDLVVVDSRPFEEYQRMNIPTATDMPGAELAYRIHDLAPDPETLVVVNCAGRTRSIIGAQSLINAGIPNPVMALKDGTMGWHLAGYELERGAAREAAPPGADGREKALAAAERIRTRFGVRSVGPEVIADWLEDDGRTTFLLDVRSPGEFAEGHLPGFRNAPGGQLVQATDEYVAVRNARLLLADDTGVRATMTASWLIQMGWRDVYILESGTGSGALTGTGDTPGVMGPLPDATMTADALADHLRDGSGQITVIDLGPSPQYERQHIPGAWWCVRARLAEALAEIPESSSIVLTSPDGLLARVAQNDVRAEGRKAQALEGGTDCWLAAGHPTASGLEHLIGPTDDVWYKPYDHRGNQEQFMRDYLTWEVALVEQIERDGTTRFQAF